MSEKSVCVQLLGGLGNQIFLYAAGLALARKLNVPLKLDVSFYRNSAQREFKLDRFDLLFEIASQDELEQTIHQRPKLSRLLVRLGLTRSARGVLYREPSYPYDSSFFELRAPVLIADSYLQSPRYFDSVSTDLRQRLRLKEETPRLLEYKRQMESRAPSVAIHLRRGDYSSSSRTLAFHGVCERSYYERAVALTRAIAGECHYFVFSDEIETAKKVLSFMPCATFVSGGSAEEDLVLMSLCSHQIIANSSFSWWAAWMNENVNKVVIAPRLWFSRETQRKWSTVDLYMDDWITL